MVIIHLKAIKIYQQVENGNPNQNNPQSNRNLIQTGPQQAALNPVLPLTRERRTFKRRRVTKTIP